MDIKTIEKSIKRKERYVNALNNEIAELEQLKYKLQARGLLTKKVSKLIYKIRLKYDVGSASLLTNVRGVNASCARVVCYRILKEQGCEVKHIAEAFNVTPPSVRNGLLNFYKGKYSDLKKEIYNYLKNKNNAKNTNKRSR